MDTISPASQTLTDLSSAADVVVELMWPDHLPTDRIGLEIEAFPILARARGPGPRLLLHGHPGVVGIVEALSSPDGPIGPPFETTLAFSTRGGGRITFEPGGQIEHSSAPHSNALRLTEEIDRTWDLLSERFGAQGAHLVSVGVDLWHDVGEVPQQHRAPRYSAMDEYFSQAWPAGAVMMRNTCSIQVNLEGGIGGLRQERWLVANLISPIISAIFATSPGTAGEKSARAVAWQRIDPTRTGFPAWDSVTEADPIRDTVSRVLNANVMFVSRDGNAATVSPGWAFGDWVRDGHPDWGHPTPMDLETHLSTLFPEVRPRRGVLEMRGTDALPRRWWLVPGLICASLLYDDHARESAIEILSHYGSNLRGIWERAAVAGLEDQQLRGSAEKLSRLALEAVGRHDTFREPDISLAEEFLERFTMRGRSPADELSSMRADPDTAIRWASTL